MNDGRFRDEGLRLWFAGHRASCRRLVGTAWLARITWLARFAMPVVTTALWAAVGIAESPAPADIDPLLARKVVSLIEEHGLDPERVSLVIRSTRDKRTLVAHRPDAPMIPASNAKLVTSYVALRELSPNYQWKTRFFLVEENDDPRHPGRQGLLVVGSGDPTPSYSDLEALALQLRLRGLVRVDGHLYYDDTLFDDQRHPSAWGPSIGDQPWYAPVSPFIVNFNIARFQVAVLEDGRGIEVLPATPSLGMQITSGFNRIPDGRERIRVQQHPTPDGIAFEISGDLPRARRTYTVTTAISDPVDHYMRLLRTSLRRAGVEGEMPIAPFPPDRYSIRLLHVHKSPPLRTLLAEMNKESNNLVAEVLLRTLAVRGGGWRVTEAEGVEILNDVMVSEFPRFADIVRLEDGSGLSRDNRLTAGFMVALLERVLARFDFRSEFLASLSLGGWDGTLQFRDYPVRQWGKIRAKSGTLHGVQNLSGYFNFGNELLVFSFLINDDSLSHQQLQGAQDRIISILFDHVVTMAAPLPSVKKALPRNTAPNVLAPPPASVKNRPAASVSSSR